MRRTSLYALAAQTAFIRVNVRQVVLNCYRIELTFLFTFTTTDTSRLASLHGCSPLVLVYATHIHASVLNSFLTQFDYVTRTSLDTCTTSRTLVFINFRESCLRIHCYRAERTSLDTVATTKATVAATCFSCSARIHGNTCTQSVILGDMRTKLTCAITTYYSDFGLSIGYCHAQKVSHLAHYISTADGTKKPIKRACVSTFHQSRSHSGASRITAASAIGTRQKLGDLPQARVFMYSKLLGTHIQHNGCNQCNTSKNNYCNQNKVHKFCICFSC